MVFFEVKMKINRNRTITSVNKTELVTRSCPKFNNKTKTSFQSGDKIKKLN